MQKDLSENNFRLIKKFDRTLVNESLSEARRSKILSTLLSLSRLLDKNWDETNKEDIEELVYNFNQKFSPNGQETNTTSDHKKILKNFYRWMKYDSRDQKSVGDPPETGWIRTKKPRETLTADMLITEAEKNSLLKACGENLRDRAFVHTFSDLACRPGEILSRQIKHVKFDDRGAVIVVDGKTGPRPVRVIECVPDLASYFDKHPNNSDPDAPLWIAMDEKKLGKPWSYPAMRKRLQRICDVAQIHKKVWPNLFRHTGATKTGMYLTESLQKVVNRPKICKICQLPNSFDSIMCSKCGKPLDLATSIEMDEKNQQQIITQNEKIEKLEKSLQTYQRFMKRRDIEFQRSMMKSIIKFKSEMRKKHAT
jgi:site-specific recombinase XerD